MITFSKPYSFRSGLGQSVIVTANPPAPVVTAPERTSGSVNLMGYDVPLLALVVATAAVVGAIWVASKGIQALDRA